METTTESANRQIAKAAGTIMAAFVLSNVVGLVRQILVSHAFGTGKEIDAFNAASTYPDLIFNLIAGGALASAFLPTFTRFLTQEDHHGAWYLASAITNLVILVLTIISLISTILSPQIVRYILAPNFGSSQQALTASLLRLLLIAPTIFGISGIMMSILNAHQIFIWSALAPSMYWLGMIFGVVILSPSLGIYGLAWGTILGAALHLGIQIPALLKLSGRKYFLSFGLRFPAVYEVGRLIAPRLLGVAVVQINFVVNTILASGQPQGSLTGIKMAWAVMTMPQVVIAQAIAIAALPTFSVQVAKGKIDNMRSSLASTLRGVILLSLPAALGLILLRQPIVAVLFQRGAFDDRSTEMVSWALLWYALGLVSHSIVEITSRAFYALHDTKTPVFVGTVAMSLNVLFSLGFSKLFTQVGWLPHGGLALANTTATTLETVGLLWIMHYRLSGIEGKSILAGFGSASLACIIMSLALWGWHQITIGQSLYLQALGGIGVGSIIYGFTILILGIKEGQALKRTLIAHLRQRL